MISSAAAGSVLSQIDSFIVSQFFGRCYVAVSHDGSGPRAASKLLGVGIMFKLSGGVENQQRVVPGGLVLSYLIITDASLAANST